MQTRFVSSVLRDARAVQNAPMLWSRARAFKLGFFLASSNRCVHPRFVFSFDPIGKGFYTQMAFDEVEQFVRKANTIGNIDFTLICGDLTQFGLKKILI